MNFSLTKDQNWYVLYTLPNYEKKVHFYLVRQRITSFLPLQRVKRKWSDRTKIVEVPLFPNYIFVKTAEKERYKILDTLGVKYYIASNGRPVLVNDKEIDNIKKLLESPTLDLEENLKVGGLVRICAGPFKDMEGTLYEKRGQTRFCVRIDSINQVLSIEVCSSWMENVKM